MGITLIPQQLARRAFHSTVALEVELANGGRHTVGSGFFIGKDLIATNLHVVHGVFGNCYAKLVNQTSEYIVEGYTQIDVEHDLIILKVSGTNAPKLLLSNSDNAQVGDTVYAVGNPRGLRGTFSDGIISGIRSDAAGKVLQMTAPTSQGSSGGAVLNSSGEVIGSPLQASVMDRISISPFLQTIFRYFSLSQRTLSPYFQQNLKVYYGFPIL